MTCRVYQSSNTVPSIRLFETTRKSWAQRSKTTVFEGKTLTCMSVIWRKLPCRSSPLGSWLTGACGERKVCCCVVGWLFAVGSSKAIAETALKLSSFMLEWGEWFFSTLLLCPRGDLGKSIWKNRKEIYKQLSKSKAGGTERKKKLKWYKKLPVKPKYEQRRHIGLSFVHYWASLTDGQTSQGDDGFSRKEQHQNFIVQDILGDW